MKVIFETERLIIREITRADSQVMLELHSDPEVHIYLGNNTITSLDKIEEAIESLIQQYSDYGVGRWAMISKDTNEFIGWTGLQYVTKEINKHKNFYDLGYRLLKSFWRQGYATESARASVDFAFNTLKAEKIYGMADIGNVGSNKILKRVGLELTETFEHEGVEHNWYRLEKENYIV